MYAVLSPYPIFLIVAISQARPLAPFLGVALMEVVAAGLPRVWYGAVSLRGGLFPGALLGFPVACVLRGVLVPLAPVWFGAGFLRPLDSLDSLRDITSQCCHRFSVVGCLAGLLLPSLILVIFYFYLLVYLVLLFVFLFFLFDGISFCFVCRRRRRHCHHPSLLPSTWASLQHCVFAHCASYPSSRKSRKS